MTDTPLWRQFRRLLLGSVVECLLDAGVAVDFASIRIAFDDSSVFHVPRLDNYMRFSGTVETLLGSVPTPAQAARLKASLSALWPDLIAVLDLPIGDALTADRARIEVVVPSVAPGALIIRFDLSAD